MNKKGFTLIELLAVIVLLAIVAGITYTTVLSAGAKGREKTETIFIETLKDAINMYIDTDGKNLSYNNKVCTISKSTGTVDVYSSNIRFSDIINSSYRPISESDFINPINKDTVCNKDASITIYRDTDYVYYYKFNGNSLDCLTISSNKIDITTLSECR